MSLDVYLTRPGTVTVRQSSGIFIRENGQTVEISAEEWNRRFPDREPVMIPEIEGVETEELFWQNITHNLGEMADKAGIYKALWRPEEIGIKKAGELIPLLEKGLADMKERPEYYQQFNSSNGWGLYKNFVPWIAKYLNACKEYPDADVRVSR